MKINGYEIKPHANLYGAYLNGADLRGADLRGADLRGAKILKKQRKALLIALEIEVFEKDG